MYTRHPGLLLIHMMLIQSCRTGEGPPGADGRSPPVCSAVVGVCGTGTSKAAGHATGGCSAWVNPTSHTRVSTALAIPCTKLMHGRPWHFSPLPREHLLTRATGGDQTHTSMPPWVTTQQGSPPSQAPASGELGMCKPRHQWGSPGLSDCPQHTRNALLHILVGRPTKGSRQSSHTVLF